MPSLYRLNFNTYRPTYNHAWFSLSFIKRLDMKGRGALRIAAVRPSVCHRTKHWPKRSINVAACEIRRVVTSQCCDVGPLTLRPSQRAGASCFFLASTTPGLLIFGVQWRQLTFWPPLPLLLKILGKHYYVTFALQHEPPICMSSVTLVYPNQTVELYRNIFAP